jgi:membrane-associated phospholipid phosphatase
MSTTVRPHAVSNRALLLTPGAALTALATAALVALSLYVRANPVTPLDLEAMKTVQGIHQDLFNFAMHIVGQPGYPPQVYIVIVIMLVILWAFHLKWEALMEVFATVGIGVVGLAIKIFVDRPRPPAELLNGGTSLDGGKYSFPAGHVQSYVAIFGFLLYLSLTLLPKNSIGRWVELAVYGLMLALIGISRVYLGEHWLTDSIGGYLLGAIWLWLTIKLYEWGKPRFFTNDARAAASSH